MNTDEDVEIKVQFYQDDQYEVVEIRSENFKWVYNQLYKGRLADCESYLRLSKEGYM